jgi:hypothetical protein
MPHGIARTVEKFHAGIRILATHPGKIQERLASAFVQQIARIVPEDDIPDLELRRDFERLMKRVTKRGSNAPIQGAIQHTILRMYVKTAVPIAEEVLYLAHQAEQLLTDEREETEQRGRDGAERRP